MPSSYTTSLRLTLPATGELAGQWGNTVNTGITELLDAAVAGTTTISTWGGAGVAYTLSNNSGTADEARRMFIVATGTPGEAKNVICPAVSKFYVFRNDTTGGFALTLKTSGGTGISVPAGQYKFLYCDGTNVVEMFNSAGALTLSGALSVGGTATFAANPTLSAGTANQVQYLNGSKVLVGSANMTFNGTDLTVSGAVNAGTVNATTLDLTNLEVTNIKAKDGTASMTLADATGVATFSANPILNAGTANGVLYLNGSKVATSVSALTFDGTSTAQVSSGSAKLRLGLDASNQYLDIYRDSSTGASTYNAAQSGGFGLHVWQIAAAEQMRLTSTGLGIGTSSPTQKLDVVGNIRGSGNLFAGFGNANASVQVLSSVSAGGAGNSELYFGNATSSTQGYLSYNHASNNLLFGTSTTTKMTLDSSGNLGLGVTPSAWGNQGPAFQLQYGGLVAGYFSSTNNQLELLNNAYRAQDTSYKYLLTTNKASAYKQIEGAHQWLTAAGGTAGNAISFTQAMTLDASGYLLVGATSSAGVGISRLQVGSTSAATTQMLIQGASTHLALYAASAAEAYVSYAVGSALIFGNGPANGSTFTERARITSGGDLLVGTTTTGFTNSRSFTFQGVGDGKVYVNHSTANVNGDGYIGFGYNGTQIGSITQNGTTAVAYNTSSDYRLKDNPQPLTGSGAFIDALQPKTWNWKADGSRGVGFIAHEAQAVSPNSVVGEKDAVDEDGKPVMQAMEYGSAEFIANIIAELQSLRARVAALEAQP